MKTFERLNKNEMKMIVGGNDPIFEGGGGIPCQSDECSTNSDCKNPSYPSCRTAHCSRNGVESTEKFCGITA